MPVELLTTVSVASAPSAVYANCVSRLTSSDVKHPAVELDDEDELELEVDEDELELEDDEA